MKATLGVISILLLALTVTTAAIAQPAAQPQQLQDAALGVWMFKNKADNQYWFHGGADAAQDVFVTELINSGKFNVLTRAQIATLMRQKNIANDTSIEPAAAARVGRLLGVNYLLTGAVTEYGVTDNMARVAMSARLIDTSTGEIVWADEVRVSVGGFGGGADEQQMFDKVMKPAIEQLVAKLLAAM